MVVAVSATNWLRSIRPLADALGDSSGRRSSMPGTPFATSLKVVLSPFRQLARGVEAIRRVIRGEDWNVPLAEPLHTAPDPRASRAAASSSTFAPSMPWRSRSAAVRKRVLRASLAVDIPQPPGLRRFADRCFDRLRRRDMDQQHRHVEQLGEADGAVGRLALGDAGMAHRVIARRAVTVVEETRGQPLDHVVVLGMDHDQRPVAPRRTPPGCRALSGGR